MKTYAMRIEFKDGTGKIIAVPADSKKHAKSIVFSRYIRAKNMPRKVTIIS